MSILSEDQHYHLPDHASHLDESLTVDLCATCQYLGNVIDEIGRSPDGPGLSISLGSVKELERKSWCRSCTIIYRYVREHNTALPPLVPLFARVLSRIVRIDARHIRFHNTICLRPLSPDLDSDFELEGRLRACDPHQADTELIRKWIHCCKVSHGDTCLTSTLPMLKHPLWLVDVRRGCLTSAPPASRYIALSYVWGVAKSVQTTKSNLHQLQTPGAITPSNADLKLPNTVKDALRLVLLLQERFLWVDSLCIVQDDDRSRQIYLKSMASIYSNAVLTVVSAKGRNADFGIRGIGNGTKPRDESCDIIKFQSRDVFIYPDRVWSAERTPWAARGWTFQEGLFSKRLLIFNGLVTWRCQRALWQEHLFHPSEDNMHTEVSFFPRSIVPLGTEVPNWPDLDRWQALVTDFNQRKLTYDSDVVNAFAGVTSALEHCFPGGILWGIPKMFLDHGLLWAPHGTLRRRETTTDVGTISAAPSWSWMGWEGEILPMRRFHYTQNPQRDHVIRLIPIVTWATSRTSSAEIFQVANNYNVLEAIHCNDNHLSLPSGWMRHSYPDNTPYFSHSTMPSVKFRYPIPLQDKEQNESLYEQGPYLHFKTQRARLFLGDILQDEPFMYRESFARRLVDENQQVVGSIRLNVDASSEQPEGETCEIISLSLGNAVASGDYYGVIDEWDILDEVVEAEVLETLELYEFYNVMWVEYQDNIAYRKAIGTIYKVAWEGQNLEQVEVTLG